MGYPCVLCHCVLCLFFAIWQSKIEQTLRSIDMEKLTIAIIGFLISFGAMWFILGMAYEKANRMNKDDDDGWY